MSTALEMRKDQAVQSFDILPPMSMEIVIARRNLMVEFVKAAMVEGVDFGKVPGTDKNTLLKPGAEKLCTLFHYTPRFEVIEKETDWTGRSHDGEMFFYFSYRCKLFSGDFLVAEGDGSCNSFEKKYRWRKSERTCPSCGQATILKSKADKGGGWFCWQKKGGCGATFAAGDPAIEGQEVGRVPNPDLADQVNTIQKMAQKRALVAATLIATNASEFFTQDLEDLVIDAEIAAPEPSQRQDASPHSTARREKMISRIRDLYQEEFNLTGSVQSRRDTAALTEDELIELGKSIAQRIDDHKNKYPVAAPTEERLAADPQAPLPSQQKPAQINPEANALLSELYGVHDAVRELDEKAEPLPGKVEAFAPDILRGLIESETAKLKKLRKALSIK